MSIFDDLRNLGQGGGLLGTGSPNQPPVGLPPLPDISKVLPQPPPPQNNAPAGAPPPPPNAPQINLDLSNIFGGKAPTGAQQNWGPPMTGPDDPDPNHRIVWESQGKPVGQQQTASNGMKYTKNEDGTTTVFPGADLSNPIKIDQSGNMMGQNLGSAISGIIGGLGQGQTAGDKAFQEMGAKQTPANNNVPPPPPQQQSQPQQPQQQGQTSQPSNPIAGLLGGLGGGGAAAALAGMPPEQIDAIAKQYGYVKAGAPQSGAAPMPTASAGSPPPLSNTPPTANWGGGGAQTPQMPQQTSGMPQPQEAAGGMDTSDPSVETLIAAINGEQMVDDSGQVILDFSQLDMGLRMAIAYGIKAYAEQSGMLPQEMMGDSMAPPMPQQEAPKDFSQIEKDLQGVLDKPSDGSLQSFEQQYGITPDVTRGIEQLQGQQQGGPSQEQIADLQFALDNPSDSALRSYEERWGETPKVDQGIEQIGQNKVAGARGQSPELQQIQKLLADSGSARGSIGNFDNVFNGERMGNSPTAKMMSDDQKLAQMFGLGPKETLWDGDKPPSPKTAEKKQKKKASTPKDEEEEPKKTTKKTTKTESTPPPSSSSINLTSEDLNRILDLLNRS